MIQQPATNQLPPGLHQTTDGRVVGVPLEAGTWTLVAGTLPSGVIGVQYGSSIEGTRITFIVDPPQTRWERIRAAWYRFVGAITK